MLFKPVFASYQKHITKRFFSSPKLLNPSGSVTQALSNTYDAIIVGGGHNGLICANYLAKAQKKVLVLERRYKIGGAAITEELYPGHHLSRASYVLSLLRKKIVDELFPSDWNQKLIYYKRQPSSFTPTTTEGRFLVLGGGKNRDFEEISKFSKKDAKNYQEYNDFLSKIVQIIGPLIDDKPNYSLRTIKHFAKQFLFQKTDFLAEFYNFLTAPASTILDKWFESDILKTTLAADSIIGSLSSPYLVGSAYILLHHVMGELTDDGSWVCVRGGMGSVTSYLGELCLKNNVNICVDANVSEILIENNKAVGVRLENGQTVRARTVLTNCTDHVTFKQLINKNTPVDEKFMSGLKNVDYEGPQTKFNIVVNDIPHFKCIPDMYGQNDSFDEKIKKARNYLSGTIHMGCSSLQDIHKAYTEAISGKYSERPYIEMTIPSVLDDSLTPKGSNNLVITLFVQYSPYNLTGGWNEKQKENWKNIVFKTIDEYAPNFSKSVLFADILTPVDLENIFNLTGGNIFHGALSLNNIYFTRPMPNFSGHDTPVQNLFRCGSGVHPGGGVMGAPGRNCANFLLKNKKI